MATKLTGDDISNSEDALYGIKLHVDRYSDAVTEILKNANIQVIQSPTCFKVIHTSFKGSFKELIQKSPELSKYPVKHYNWWHRITDLVKSDEYT